MSDASYSYHEHGYTVLQSMKGKAAERKGRPVSISQRQEQSLDARDIPVTLPRPPWEKRNDS